MKCIEKYRNDVTTAWQILISSLSSPSPRSMKMQLKAYLGLSTYRNMMHMTQEVIHEVTTVAYTH